MKSKLALAVLVALGLFIPRPEAAAQYAVQMDTPMHFSKKLSGDQPLRFTAGGSPVRAKGGKLSYRVITTKAEWKKVWGYLYDDTVAVDFTKYRVLAIYKSGAAGGYTFVPKRVYNFQDTLSIDLDVVWDGKQTRSNPFLFLVVDKFKKLEVNEKPVAPPGKKPRLP